MPLLALLKVLGQVVLPATQAYMLVKEHFDKKKKEKEEAKKPVDSKEEKEKEKKS